MQSYEILKTAVQKAGAKKVAFALGVSVSLVYKWCEKPPDDVDFEACGAVNPLDRIRKLYDLTGDQEMIDAICAMGNGYFVPQEIVDDRVPMDTDVFRNVQKMIREFSEALDAISGSYDNGRRIDQQEAKIIRKEWNDLKRVGESFVRACEQGQFDHLC